MSLRKKKLSPARAPVVPVKEEQAPPVEEPKVELPVEIPPPDPPISAYPLRLIERWESEDKREIRKLEACAYGGNGIVIKTSTRFLDASGNVTACSEALAAIPGVSMSTFKGSRAKQKAL